MLQRYLELLDNPKYLNVNGFVTHEVIKQGLGKSWTDDERKLVHAAAIYHKLTTEELSRDEKVALYTEWALLTHDDKDELIAATTNMNNIELVYEWVKEEHTDAVYDLVELMKRYLVDKGVAQYIQNLAKYVKWIIYLSTYTKRVSMATVIAGHTKTLKDELDIEMKMTILAQMVYAGIGDLYDVITTTDGYPLMVPKVELPFDIQLKIDCTNGQLCPALEPYNVDNYKVGTSKNHNPICPTTKIYIQYLNEIPILLDKYALAMDIELPTHDEEGNEFTEKDLEIMRMDSVKLRSVARLYHGQTVYFANKSASGKRQFGYSTTVKNIRMAIQSVKPCKITTFPTFDI